MTWAAIALLWCASAYRIRAAARRPDFITISYCGAAVAITLAFTLTATTAPIDRVSTANLTDLLEHVLVVFGGVAAQLFLLALRTGRPHRRAAGIRLAIAVAVSLIMIALYTAARTRTAPAGLDDTNDPLTTVMLYRPVFNAYLTYVLIDNVRLCSRYAAAPGDAGRSAGLRLLGWGSLVATAYPLSRLVYLLVFVTGRARPQLLYTFGSVAAAVGLCGIALGMLAPTVLPAVRRWYAAVHELRATRQLWQDLTDQFPELVLPTGRPLTMRRAEHRRDRRLIEITEGLARIQLPVHDDGHRGAEHLGRALFDYGPPWPTSGGTAVLAFLPTLATSTDETLLLIRAASTYADARTPRHQPEVAL